MKRMRWVILLLIVGILVGSTGCGSLKKKFIRKPKNVPKPDPIFVLDKVHRPEYPPEVRYGSHFAYWKAAHAELIESLEAKTRIARIRAARNAAKELKAMQKLLKEPLAGKLQSLVNQLDKVVEDVTLPNYNEQRAAIFRSRMEYLYRQINKHYHPSEVTPYLQPDFPEEVTLDAGSD